MQSKKRKRSEENRVKRRMDFRVDGLRLEHSKWGGYYLAIDFSPNVSTGIKISKKRFLELTKTIETFDVSNLLG